MCSAELLLQIEPGHPARECQKRDRRRNPDGRHACPLLVLAKPCLLARDNSRANQELLRSRLRAPAFWRGLDGRRGRLRPRRARSYCRRNGLFRGIAAMTQLASARRPPPGVPTSAIDPFSLDFLRDPHPAHEALREAGRSSGRKVWRLRGRAACRGQADPQRSASFCSGRGVGLSDFQREKPWRPPSLVLSATRPSTIARAPCSIALYRRR